VTLCTREITGVVSGIVRGVVHKYVWFEEIGGVAFIARLGCLEMPGIHSGSRRAVMTAITGAG